MREDTPMQYGHFDNRRREYVIDRVDVPVSWQPCGNALFSVYTAPAL